MKHSEMNKYFLIKKASFTLNKSREKVSTWSHRSPLSFESNEQM